MPDTPPHGPESSGTDGLTPVFASPGRATCDERALVLTAVGIVCQLDYDGWQYRLSVAYGDLPAARLGSVKTGESASAPDGSWPCSGMSDTEGIDGVRVHALVVDHIRIRVALP